MPQPGSDSSRSSSPSESVVVTRPRAPHEAFSSSFLDVDNAEDAPDDGTDEPAGSPSLTARGCPTPLGARDPLDDNEVLRISLDRTLRAEAGGNFDDTVDPFGKRIQGDGRVKYRVPFHRWVRTLHRRHLRRQKMLGADMDMPAYEKGPAVGREAPEHLGHHRRSSSESSLAFVTAVKSVSVSLASASIIGRSRRNTVRSSRAYSRTDRSSRASISGARHSEDSQFADGSTLLDPAVAERAVQRRRILEELISTEEGYIGDIKFLMNVYVTILASLPTSQSGLRSSISRNLTDIIELHEEILGELHQVVPDSEYGRAEALASPSSTQRPHHQRWRSLDAVPENKDGMSWLQQAPGRTSDPQTAADVAQAFAKRVNRFFAYEEYGAKYELMIKDIAIIHRAMPEWDKYQKGLEALAASLCSTNNSEDPSRRALTVGDLLVKPIQRMCKYPLLFAELLKHTPVCDCPYSYMEIESALIRLREATGAINRATDDERTKATLEKTWLLQDRLVFPDQRLDTTSRSRIRAFGHVQLCGVLHVCWQTKDGVKGSYMVCLLYRECLCLASAGKSDQTYTIQACLALSGINVEDVDNGRGLQCHTAPFSWKLVFECDHQLFEIIMTACTPKEEVEWRTRLNHAPSHESYLHVGPLHFSSLALNIKALGAVYGKPGTVTRRISIHRATTVGPKSPLCQVILKNTSVEREATVSASKSSINRSQSLLTTNSRIPVLAPSRGDRARLEALLSDVWTREVLPFPGITVRARSEHLVRSSASSVMRKLSVASIASSFTKRSSSNASMHMTSSSDEPAGSLDGPRGPARSMAFLAAEEASQSRLSVISDEAGKRSPTPAAPQPEDPADYKGTVRRVEALKLESDWGPDGRGDGFSLLRAASFDSLRSRTRRSSRSSKKSAKEGLSMPSQETCKASSIKSAGQWGRVGIIHRAVMVDGIRNLFR